MRPGRDEGGNASLSGKVKSRILGRLKDANKQIMQTSVWFLRISLIIVLNCFDEWDFFLVSEFGRLHPRKVRE